MHELNSAAVDAIELLGDDLGGIVVIDLCSDYNYLSTLQGQPCWAYLIPDQNAIA